MKLSRRQFLHPAAGATALPAVSRAIAISSTLMRVDGISKAGMADYDDAEDHVYIVVAA
jgi:hypothetical protein